jgi:hypothetical protein
VGHAAPGACFFMVKHLFNNSLGHTYNSLSRHAYDSFSH